MLFFFLFDQRYNIQSKDHYCLADPHQDEQYGFEADELVLRPLESCGEFPICHKKECPRKNESNRTHGNSSEEFKNEPDIVDEDGCN